MEAMATKSLGNDHQGWNYIGADEGFAIVIVVED